MAKSFKRAIACLLAVLMVAFSMPFAAMAAVGDYEPDIELLFYPVFTDGGWGNYDDVVGAKGKDVSYHITDGAADVALDYDSTAGTLTLSKTKAATYLNLNEIDIQDTILWNPDANDGDGAAEDYVLGAGDYFAATVVCKNISTLYAISGAISYSSSIVPAGVYVTQTGSGTRRVQTAHLSAVDDFASGAVSTEGPYYDGFSAAAFYTNADTEMNEIDARGNIFFAVAGDSPYSDITPFSAEDGMLDPITGEDGWTAANTAIIGTYIFKIVSDAPITFEGTDPNNTIYNNPNYTGGLYIADFDEGTRNPDDLTTYAGGTHAGAGKMTFFADPYVPAEGECEHTNTTTTYENEVAATCTTAGSRDVVVTCSDCGAEISRTPETIPALGHDLGNWTETTAAVAATCTEAGATAIETRTCSRCDYFETRGGDVVDALGHDLGAWVETTAAVAPTCTEAGATAIETRTCSRCDYSETRGGEAVDALGHDLGAWTETTAAVAPTCTEAGATAIETRTCSRCDYSETRGGEEVAALGHDYVPTVVEPTCTEQGYTTYTCSRCDDSYVADYTDALGHDLGGWTETTAAVAPDCTHTGTTAIETRYCSRCDYSETRGGEEVAALGHDPLAAVEENRVEATCTAAGSYDLVVYCNRCGEELSREPQTIEALGHDLGDWEASGEAVAPTCTLPGANGGEIRRCSRCDYFETRGGEEIPALGHDPLAAVEENRVEATCTAAGSYDLVVYCNRCGEELSREPQTIEALGHDLGGWAEDTAAVAPTCTEPGATAIEKRTCSRCDYFETRGGEEVAALGHDFGEWTVITEATKEEAGLKRRECSRCDAYEEEVIPALGVLVTVDYDPAVATVTFVGGTATDDVKVRSYAYGAVYKAKVTYDDSRYNFIGWEINNKKVSESTLYSNVAYADVTIKPVLVEKAETFKVVFYDMWGNEIGVAEDCTAGNVEAPAAPARPGYVFKEWNPSLDSITSATKVYAKYEKDAEAEELTVTAEGATITIKGVEYEGTATALYDTKVKVYKEGATAWMIDDVVVGYGDTYEFYIGANTTLTYTVEAIDDQVASVAITSAAPISDYKFNIIANKNIPDGYELKDCGFVYGKNLTDAECDLDNVGKTGANANAGQVKAKRYGAITADQFALSYGLSKKDGSFIVKAFIVVVKDGKTEIIYDAQGGFAHTY